MSSQTPPPSVTTVSRIESIKHHIRMLQNLHGQRLAEYHALRSISSYQHNEAFVSFVLGGLRIPRGVVDSAVRTAYLQHAMSNDVYYMRVLEREWKDLAWAELERVDAERMESERRREEEVNRNMVQGWKREMEHGREGCTGEKGRQGGKAAGAA